ncbi:MAG: phosphatase PAP2 family protein [Deltaproteobacteria bacterium]|nr:phosphatase PAP2 family protein [Deltaproteobacteria bacterium]
MLRALSAALLLALLAPRPAAAAAPEELRLDLTRSAVVTGALLAGSLATALWQDRLTPPRCRVCGAGALDTWARDQLRWADGRGASTASDVMLVAVPALAGGALLVSSLQHGDARTALEDGLMLVEATSVAVLATQVAKLAAARLRPYAWADPAGGHGPDSRRSFWSGHTAFTFAAASAAGTVARLRGYRSWPWILGLGLAGAAATGWLRMAADRHWATDVLVGAAVGTAAGLGIPAWLHGRRGDAGAPRVALVPLGIAGTF